MGRDVSIFIYIYLLQASDVLQNAHLQFHVTSTAKDGRNLEKQNIPKRSQLVQISYMNF